MYVPPILVDLQDFCGMIVNTIALIDPGFLRRVWQELRVLSGCLPHYKGKSYWTVMYKI